MRCPSYSATLNGVRWYVPILPRSCRYAASMNALTLAVGRPMRSHVFFMRRATVAEWPRSSARAFSSRLTRTLSVSVYSFVDVGEITTFGDVSGLSVELSGVVALRGAAGGGGVRGVSTADESVAGAGPVVVGGGGGGCGCGIGACIVGPKPMGCGICCG